MTLKKWLSSIALECQGRWTLLAHSCEKRKSILSLVQNAATYAVSYPYFHDQLIHR
jgi:hypothetical protein